jgi:hypothetical protein
MLRFKIDNILENWIKEMSDKEIVPENIQALNFGIFESENGYTIYLTGSTEYDIEDDDWACNNDFVPNNKYLEFSQREIISIDWKEFLNLIAESLNNIIKSKESSKYKILNVDNITTGFDAGELVKVK